MKGKRFVHMLLPRKDCQLDFSGLLVYSYLTYLTRHKREASLRSIGAALGLHRVKTVRDAIAKLTAFGLAEAKGQKYQARDGQATWFHQRKDASEHWHWVDRYAHFRLYLPASDCPLSPRQNAVLWLLNSWQKKPKAVKRQGLATQLRISKRTVIRSVNTLKEMGLWDGAKVTVEDHQVFWQDAKTKVAQNDDRRPSRLGPFIMRSFPDDYEMRLYAGLEDMQAALGRHEERLIAAEYRARDIEEVWEHAWGALDLKCGRMECYAYHFWKMLEVVEKETQRNRRRGVFHGPNSKGLLMARTTAFGRQVHVQIGRNGPDSLLGWEPNFEKMNGEAEAKVVT